MNAFAARILVTGGAGFVGAAVSRAGGGNTIGITRDDADLTTPSSIHRLCEEMQPTGIIHLAAVGLAGARAHSPELVGANVQMTVNVIKAAPAGCRIVIAGSMAEYGRSGVLREVDPCTPRTAYGISKLAASLFALAYTLEHEIVVARLFGVFGAGEPPGRLFPSLIGRLIAGRPVPLSDGQQLRDFIHVDDVANVLLSLCISALPPSRIVNVGTGIGVRVRDAAQWIAEAFDANAALLRFGERERSPGDEDELIADVTLLRSVTGLVPPQRIKSGLDPSLFVP